MGFTLRNYEENWWPWFRLGEIYLNAAEASFELDDQDPGALYYINKLRERAGFPANSLTSLTLEKIQNERRVEFAFEEHRFWDVRRWKIGNSAFASVQGADLKLVNGDVMLSRKTIARGWDDKYYLFPIPQSEIQKNPKLTQNPGW